MFEELKRDPFEWADSKSISIKGNELNPFRKWKRIRQTALGFALVCLALWILLGFDSTFGQLIHPLYNLPRFISGELSLADLAIIFRGQYGKEMHFSAGVIYGLCYYGLSKHFEKQEIEGSRNVSYCLGVTLFTIGLFEFYWMFSYAIFQGQTWVVTPRFPQLKIIIQNALFVFAGSMVILQIWVDTHTWDIWHKGGALSRDAFFNWSFLSKFLVVAGVGFAVLWWFYPLPSQGVTVELETGETWISTNRFPQTLYTVDLNPQDEVNAGVWFWVENDMVHALNTWVKILWTLAIFNIARVARKS